MPVAICPPKCSKSPIGISCKHANIELWKIVPTFDSYLDFQLLKNINLFESNKSLEISVSHLVGAHVRTLQKLRVNVRR